MIRTTRGKALAEVLRVAVEHLRELDKVSSDDVDEIVAAMVSTLRGLRPESVMPLGTLPSPEAPNADPRGDA